jgi:DNA-binding beta-propeller fold protein YncE
MAVAQFANGARVLFPGSVFSLRLAQTGAPPANAYAIGPGRIVDGAFVLPLGALPARATVVAAASGAVAMRALRIAAPPRGPALAVASYDDGIVFHDPRTFAVLGTLATGGAPSDVASMRGRLVATDTDGDALTAATLRPWSVARIAGVPLGDAVAADAPLRAFFVTERDFAGLGGVARVTSSGIRTAVTGETAEGVVVDPRRQRVYVADTNADSVAILDARTMRVLGRIGGLARAFSLALSAGGRTLYVVSNQGATTMFAAAGRVTAIDVSARPRIVARSENLPFPLGVAFDARDRALFVTDEQADAVYVFDPRTLERRAVVRTCRTPWQPAFDPRSDRLFIPCAQSDEVDVLDARTLTHVHGAPFATGGYPLAVTVAR